MTMINCGEFKTSYAADTTMFPTPWSGRAVIASVALAAALPLLLGPYHLNLLIQIGYYAIAALGLNLLTGFTGQISIGHAAFFGFGAFASAYLNNRFGIPVALAIPLAGLWTTAVGLIVGIPAGRIKGLYLAIATFAAQFILQDFFARASWFSGGSAGALAEPFSLFGWQANNDQRYFYVVLAYLILAFVAATNLLRTRDGRAFVALRDHYLSAEMMGINLTRYRILSFGLSAFYAGIGGALYAHYLGFVSVEAFTILLSIQFLAMVIIGGLGSVMGTLLGTAFIVLLPEVMEGAVGALKHTTWGNIPAITNGLVYLKEAAVGLAIVLFLIFEPDGLAHRWQQIKAYWKLYPFAY